MTVAAGDPIVELAVSVGATPAEALRTFFTREKIPVDPVAAAAQLACVGG